MRTLGFSSLIICTTAAFGAQLKAADLVPLEHLPQSVRLGVSPSCQGVWVNSFSDNQLRQGQLRLEAETLDFLLDRRATASGQVLLEWPNYRLTGESVNLDLETERWSSEETSQLYTAEYYLNTGQFTHQQQQTQTQQTEFVHFDSQFSGFAQQAELLPSGQLNLKGLSFSRCLPEQRSWHVQARELKVDPEQGTANFSSATLYIQGVPVFWTPYLSVPLDDRRKSGLLTPSFSLDSTGITRFNQELYLNLAANYDATLGYGYYAQAGHLLGGEARYLNRYGRAQLDLDWLARAINPRTLDDQSYARWYARTQVRQSVRPWSMELDLASTSDEFWALDFAGASQVQNHQNQFLRLGWADNNRSASLIWQQQALVKLEPRLSDRRYRLWPRLTLGQQQQWGQFRTWQQSQLTHFSYAEDARLEPDIDMGQSLAALRHHLQLNNEWRWQPSYGLSRVRLDLVANQYQLYQQGLDPVHPSNNAWLVPILSLEQQLIFDRDWQIAGQSWLHSLQPAIRLNYVPLIEQQLDNPVFDSQYSSALDQNYNQALRFSGADRFGDTLRLNLSLGSQWQRRPGPYALRTQLSQGLLLQQQRLKLNSLDEPNNEQYPQLQDLQLTNNLQLASGWQVQAQQRWQPSMPEQLWPTPHELSNQSYSLRWRGSNRGLFNLQWQQNLTTEEESARIDLVLPIQRRYGLYVSSQFNQLPELDWRLRQTLVGIEWDDCCWHSRIIAFHQPLYDDEPEVVKSKTNLGNGLRFEFNLKGLAGRNDGIDTLLTTIPGYRGPLFQTE